MRETSRGRKLPSKQRGGRQASAGAGSQEFTHDAKRLRVFIAAAILSSIMLTVYVIWGCILIDAHGAETARTGQGTNGPIAGMLVVFVLPIVHGIVHGLVVATLAIIPGISWRALGKGLSIALLGPALVTALVAIVGSWFSVYLEAPGELNGQPVWPAMWSVLLGEFIGAVLVGVPGILIRLNAKNGTSVLPVEADETDLDELFNSR
ncbi:hypothetical protein M3D15_05370 [Pseudoclavibacter alba]|uniref:Uncharacterized protein n=1 Tax=Pseudoclavibacter albus TaxID=272241 RepID=A0ABT2HWS6_9MICO|nr:hypothetical protein [Pseudoclavibacter alba]MCT2042763.1 hypothetical protein [Pseudoclavibacter alba]